MTALTTPTRNGGRKATLVGGTRINIYMDTASHATAKQLGRGNVSVGIRLALANSLKTDDVSVVQSTQRVYSDN